MRSGPGGLPYRHCFPGMCSLCMDCIFSFLFFSLSSFFVFISSTVSLDSLGFRPSINQYSIKSNTYSILIQYLFIQVHHHHHHHHRTKGLSNSLYTLNLNLLLLLLPTWFCHPWYQRVTKTNLISPTLHYQSINHLKERSESTAFISYIYPLHQPAIFLNTKLSPNTVGSSKKSKRKSPRESGRSKKRE